MYGIGLHPLDEAREGAYDLPGSFLALPSALMRRVRPIRFDLPDQPMLWVALVLTLLTTIPLLDRRTTGGDAVGVAVGLALTTLAATWVFAIRAFGARGWDRASYRLTVDFAATINGQPAAGRRRVTVRARGRRRTGDDRARLDRGRLRRVRRPRHLDPARTGDGRPARAETRPSSASRSSSTPGNASRGSAISSRRPARPVARRSCP